MGPQVWAQVQLPSSGVALDKALYLLMTVSSLKEQGKLPNIFASHL